MDVGDSGRHSDGGGGGGEAFILALLKLLNNEIPIPEPEAIGDFTLPYVFVGNEAYPLRTKLLWPYPGRGLNDTRRVYNYRHSRSRRQVECGFGMLVNRWAVMKNRISMSPERVTKVVLACCILHNHVRRQENPSAVDHTEDNNINPPKPRDDLFDLGVGRPSVTSCHACEGPVCKAFCDGSDRAMAIPACSCGLID